MRKEGRKPPLFKKDCKEAKAHIKELLEQEYVKHIVTIDNNSNPDFSEAIQAVNEYKKGHEEMVGLWILIGGDKEVINVGQSKDFISEIIGILNSICEGKKEDGYKELFDNMVKMNKGLSFYEINIDKYIKYNNPYDNELKSIVYDLAKRYIAEVLVAMNTAATNWYFYNSGMDYLFYDKLRNDEKLKNLNEN